MAPRSVIGKPSMYVMGVLVAVFLALTTNAAATKKRVLILHSYHQGFSWTDNIMAGMLSVLDNAALDLEIHVEYMDTKRHPPGESFSFLESFYHQKYSQTPIDVILLSDNNALSFVVSRRQSLFPGVPVVFCGINNFSPELLGNQTGITGVTEEIDIKGTIGLATHILPGIRHIIAINDQTPTGRANREKLNAVIAGSPDASISFEIWDNLTASDLQNRLAGLSTDTVVFVFTFHRDRDGRWFSIPEYLTLVRNSCNVPVFSFWEHYLGFGVLGGTMVYGKEQGRRCAEYALRILQGASPATLPVLLESPNIPVVDHRLLTRFAISRDRLPASAVVLFAPESIFRKYRLVIIASSVSFVVLIALVITLSVNILRRKRSERERVLLNTDLATKNAELEQIIYVTSHDLRSPLVNIAGYSKELDYAMEDLSNKLADVRASDAVKPILEEDIPEALRFIRTSVSKMDTLLAGLLRLSRSGRTALTIETLDMNDLIAKVLASIEFQIRETGVRMDVADLPPCRGSAVQVNQVFTNLLDNAVKYRKPGRSGHIRITGRMEAERSVYCVSDNGIGIARDHLDKIFKIFHRLNVANGEGEGLGLTIVKQTVDRLHGDIRVESELGIGSRFYVALPAGRKK